MTVQDLLDQAIYDSGDGGADYTNSARRWLNLTRSYIADQHAWQCASRVNATLTTTNGTAIYTLVSGSDTYRRVIGNMMYDQTNDTNIRYTDTAFGLALDQDQDETGPPVVWWDAGCTSAGVRQVEFYPVPGGTYTILFAGQLILSDLTAAQDTVTEDPYYGPITPWGATFQAGMRYFHDLNNNEDVNQIAIQKATFDMLIRNRKRVDSTPTTPIHRARSLREGSNVNLGRLDPSVYEN